MLEDRAYMRAAPFNPRRSATVVLLVVNCIAFVVQCLYYGYPPRVRELDWFALSTEGLRHGWVWQLLTYQFMHGGIIHLLLNCWAIFVFGREVEDAVGVRRFLTLYFGSGVIGGLFQSLLGALLGGPLAAPVVGASAGAFGLTAAFAVLFPERTLTLLLFFIIPVSMRAKYLLLACVLLSVFGLLFGTDNVAHAAHLGGMATGIFFIRYAGHWHWRWPSASGRSSSASRRPLVRVFSGKATGLRTAKPSPSEEPSSDDFLSKEVDPILDKISAHGIHSLTDRERRILERAREKMGRR